MPRKIITAEKIDELATASDSLLTIEQVAQLLHCSASNLNKWRLSGKGPRFVRVGSLIRYRTADIQAFIATSMSNSTSSGDAPPAA